MSPVASARPLHIVALGELPTAEADKARRLVSQVIPGAAILGISVTPRSWDVRPVVVARGEPAPSLIRFLGPEVTLSLGISSRMQELLDRIIRHPDLSSRIIEWGLLEGQLWYRRELVDRTFAEVVADHRELSLTEVLGAAKGLTAQLQHWHTLGLVHGHLVPENIHIDSLGKVAFLDPGVALSVVQASNWLQLQEFPVGYTRDSFAPELLSGESPVASGDVYGLGLIFGALLRNLEGQLHGAARWIESSPATTRSYLLSTLKGLSERMCHPDPKHRPSLDEVAELLEVSLPTYRSPVSRETLAVPAEASPLAEPSFRGKIITPRTSVPARATTPRTLSPSHPASHPRAVPQDGDPLPSEILGSPEAAPAQEIPPAAVVTPQDTGALGGAFTSPYTGPTPAYVALPLLQGFPTPGPIPGGVAGVDPSSFQQPVPSSYSPQQLPAQQVRGLPPPPPPQNHLPSPPVGVPPIARKFANGVFYLIIAFLVLSGIFFSGPLVEGVKGWFSGGEKILLSNEDLRAMWESHRPSQMREVLFAAIDPRHPNAFAENLIVQSAMGGDEVADVIDVMFIRVAFDRRWEMELSADDRRAALALAAATSRLLPDIASVGSLKFDGLHPGVILALAAAVGEQGEQTILAQVPAGVLIGLPPPLKPAFGALLKNRSGLSAAAFPIRTLARFATRGIQSVELLERFLAEEPEARLLCLAILFSEDDLQAGKVLDMLLHRPLSGVELPGIHWGKRAEILSWRELDHRERLFLVAGVPPSGGANREHLKHLLEHPGPSVRRYALEQVAGWSFPHPAAPEVFRLVRANPVRLTPAQTVELVRILADPGAITEARVVEWLNAGVEHEMIGLAELMLVGSSTQTHPTLLDTVLSRYLRRRSWQPSVESLSKLMSHPDDVTRMFAYSKIYDLPDTKQALAMLRDAVGRERRATFKKQLETMISDLVASGA